jgi:hypothetical protein
MGVRILDRQTFQKGAQCTVVAFPERIRGIEKEMSVGGQKFYSEDVFTNNLEMGGGGIQTPDDPPDVGL